jgi:hypothetical protein
MALKNSVSHSLPSRYNRAFGLFLSVVCIVCSSILPVLAKAVLWVSTQSFFLYPIIVAGLCFLKLDERNTLFRESVPKFRNKNDIFSGATFQLEPFLINRLFLLRAILGEQGGADGRKGTGNCIMMGYDTDHRTRAIALLNISILFEQFLLE